MGFFHHVYETSNIKTKAGILDSIRSIYEAGIILGRRADELVKL